MKKTISKQQVVVSILALLNVMFVPLFDVWGGLFPSHPDETFWDVVTGGCEPEQWIFVFTLAALVPSVLMLLFSLLKAKVLARLAGAAGLIWMIADLIFYVNQYEIDYLFDFEDGSLCIGLWIAVLLFLIMTVMPAGKSRSSVTPQEPIPGVTI